jgi:hypothetical protein
MLYTLTDWLTAVTLGVSQMGQAKVRKDEIAKLKAKADTNRIAQQAAKMNGWPGIDMPDDVLESLGDILLTTKDGSKDRGDKLANFMMYQAYKAGGKDAMLAMQDIIKQAIPNN